MSKRKIKSQYSTYTYKSEQDAVLQKGPEKNHVVKTILNLMWQFSEGDEGLYC